MTCAVSDGQVISIARNFVTAALGDFKGYRVELHALPGYVFRVEAATGDEAIRIACAVARSEGRKLASDAATFQAL